MRRRVSWLALCAAALAFAGWEGTLSRDAPSAHWSVLGSVALGVALAVALGSGRQRMPSTSWARSGLDAVLGDVTRTAPRPWQMSVGVAVWTVLILAVIGWDLNSFAHQAHDLPTLSRLIGDVTAHAWGRALLFAGWLGLGGYLACGWRRPHADEALRA